MASDADRSGENTLRKTADLVGAPQRAVPCALALTGVRQSAAMAAQEIAPRAVQTGDALTTGDPVHDAGANEIRSDTAKPARRANDADGLRHILPKAAANAHAVEQMWPVAGRPRRAD